MKATTKTLRLILFVLINLPLTSVNSQVVINEVMAYPSGSQGMIVFGGNSGNEYVELYNPTCSSVDVSGFFIGSRQDFAGTMSGGAFRIPNVAAAIIPPNGHLVIGTSTSSADPNSIDIKTPSYTSNYCQNSSSNFILANADGWVGLYNAAGVPIDAIYWSSSAANISNAGDYTGTPCVPTGSPAGVGLESAQQINSGYPGVLNYVGNTTSMGKTFSRIPDGGAWVRDITASINHLTVGNCNGGTCVTAATFGITASTIQPTCGNPNGSITITPTTTGTYTYTWTPNVSTTNSATNLAANSYLIHIDKGGCTKDTTITLVNGSFPTAIVVTPTNPDCGLSNGQVILGAVTGGIAPYQYNFNGLGFSSTTSYTNLAAGTYTVVVKDNNGCTYTASSTVLTSSNGPTAITATPTNPGCGASDGQVVLGTVTGGTAPYQYNFNGLGFSSTTSYTNLAAGTYTVVVKDNNGCTYTAPNTVLTSSNGPTAITVTPTNPGCGASDGQVVLGTVTGGTAPYQYNFNGLGLSLATSYINLAANSYSLIIQDNNGCIYTAPNVVLTSANGPTAIIITPTNTSCGASDGQILLGAVTGGIAPYQYNFNGLGLSSTTLFTNLNASSYTLVVRDNNGCTYTAPNIVLTAGNGPSAIIVTVTNETCTLVNGQVSLGTVTGGSAPYQYNFNNTGFSANINYSNLASGNYSLIVQDNTGCSFTAPSVVVVNSAGPTGINTTFTDETCSLSNGTITLGSVIGGTPSFQYNLNGLGYSSTTTYSNLIAGTYTLNIKDQNGCTISIPSIVLSNTVGISAVLVTETNSTCNLNNGSLLIGAVTGGLPPFQYNFNALGYSNLNNYQNLASSSYTLSLQDGNGCIYNAPPVIIANTTGPNDLEIISSDATCDLKNGAISITNVLGGLAPYTYSIDGISFTNDITYTNLLAGNYSISVQDGNGCIYGENTSISNHPSPAANFNYTPAIIKNEKEDVTLTDESSGTIVSYLWVVPDGLPNSSSTQNFNTKFKIFDEGFYPMTLIVTNEYGCIDSITKYIERRIDPIIYVPNTFTPDGDEHNNSWQYALTGLDLQSFNMKVFDRWGEIVWESSDQKASWDGFYKGKIVQSGTYTWVMNAKDNIEDKHMELVGCLNVIY